MAQDDGNLSRRGVIAGAGIGVGAGLLAELGGGQALAQGAAMKPEKQPGKIWSGDYWAKKGEVSLYLFRKRIGAPKPGASPLPVLFLVHGSSISSRPSFDLTVPKHGEYSVMNVFAELGYDVWTMDHENYGRSSRTKGNSDIASGVEDLKAGTDLVVRETGRQKLHMFGESSGALRAGAFAMARPERIDRLVFSAFTYKGADSPTLKKRAEQVEYYRTHNLRLRDSAMIHSIFTRDKPGTSDPALADFLAEQELQIRRSGADRNLSRHDRQPAGGGSHQGAGAGAADARRIRRHRHGRRHLRLLQGAAEWRPPARDPAGHRPFRGAGPQPAASSGTSCTRSSPCRSRWRREASCVFRRAPPP